MSLLRGYASGRRSFEGLNLREAFLSGEVLGRSSFRGSDLGDAVMSGCNLFLADFSGASLLGADLREAVLAASLLCDADLRGADLSGAVLLGADLRGAELSGCNLRGARFDRRTRWPRGFDVGCSGAWGPEVDLGGASLAREELAGASLEGASLRGADLRGANLQGCNLRGADLSGADLRGADLTASLLQDAWFFGARSDLLTRWPEGWQGGGPILGPRCSWEGMRLPHNLQAAGAMLAQGRFAGASLARGDFRGADFRGADLSDADLAGADLRGAVFRGASLRRASLIHTRLDGADLAGVCLDGAFLTGASLCGANLRASSLVGVEWSFADLSRVDLSDADLRGGKGVPDAARGTRLNEKTAHRSAWGPEEVVWWSSMGADWGGSRVPGALRLAPRLVLVFYEALSEWDRFLLNRLVDLRAGREAQRSLVEVQAGGGSVRVCVDGPGLEGLRWLLDSLLYFDRGVDRFLVGIEETRAKLLRAEIWGDGPHPLLCLVWNGGRLDEIRPPL